MTTVTHIACRTGRPGSRAIPPPLFRCAALLLALTVAACSGEAPLAPFPWSRSDLAKSDESLPHKGSTSLSANADTVSAPLSVPAPAPAPPEPAAPPPKPDWQLLLEDGIESYENGAYGNAIRKLESSADNAQADKVSRVKALKYLAFSYCVSPDPAKNKSTNHLTLCRQTFERALAVDPKFDLAPGERGHPVWGKQFQAARLAQSKKNSPEKASAAAANTAQPTPSAARKGEPAASGAAAGTSKP